MRANPTIADVVKQIGYHTVYSTDEVRFANIDESYGFDQVITPRIGASDFLIGTYNELPLASLVINTRVGKWLFPFSHANRGVATMFKPETYVERLEREVSFDKPTLFISHLTAAHWPYYTADTPFGVSKQVSDEDRPLYRIGLKTADRMFGELVAMLEAKGALQNALVIVLSDHGEALGLPTDSFFVDETFRVEGLKAPLRMAIHGHGQSVLSKSQYQVLLGFALSAASRALVLVAVSSSTRLLSRTSRQPYLASSGSEGIRCLRPARRCCPCWRRDATGLSPNSSVSDSRKPILGCCPSRAAVSTKRPRPSRIPRSSRWTGRPRGCTCGPSTLHLRSHSRNERVTRRTNCLRLCLRALTHTSTFSWTSPRITVAC